LSIATLVALLILKIVATSLTVNFGWSGGLFIPSCWWDTWTHLYANDGTSTNGFICLAYWQA